MALTAAERQRKSREGRKALKRLQDLLTLEILDGIQDGSLGIGCDITTDLWGINFDWTGEQSAYDAIETRCNAVGFSLAEIKDDLEQRTVKGYRDQLDAKREGK